MVPSVYQGINLKFGIEKVLYDRASLYSPTPAKKRMIVEKTILVVSRDPNFFTHKDVEEELFRVMHRVVQEQLASMFLPRSSRATLAVAGC